MAAADFKKTSWLVRLLPKRLTMGLGVAVCIAVFITEIIFLIPAAYFWHQSNQADAIEEVRQAWYHASDPAAFLTARHKTRLGERMVRDGLLLGGVVFDSAGEPLAVFGERPMLDMNIARLSGVSVQPSPSSPALDVHLSPEQTGLSHHLIVRLPTAAIEAKTLAEVQSFALSVLFIAGFTALLFILASLFLVIRPLRAINDSLRQAVDNPDGADAFQLRMGRRDELGQIAKSLNMLLTSVSVVYQDELLAIKTAIDGFGFGIIQYDYDGRVVAANPSAVEMFKVTDFNALRKMNRNCAAPLGARKAEPQPILTVLGDSREPILLTIHTEFGYFTAMAYCVSIRRKDGSIVRQFAAIMPMDDILHTSRKAITDANKVVAHNQKLTVEAREMRRLFESCLCILELSNYEPSQIEEAVLPDRILNAWYNEALSDDLVSGRLEHGLLPGVRGEPEAIRTVLRQAMLLVYSQTSAERPVLKVEAEHLDEKRINLIISDKSRQVAGSSGIRRKGVDPTLPRAALVAALKHAGGSFGALEMHEGRAELKFSLSKGNLVAEGVELLKSA